MVTITATDEWKHTHPAGIIGILEVSGIDNSTPSSALNEKKRLVEIELRERYKGFSRADFMATPVLADYEKYYKSFEKTYHVQLQIESIVLKGKNLPDVSPLVDSNFVAEVETFVLTAGHDVSKLAGEVFIDVSKEGDQITQMNGTTKPIRSGDMIMRDGNGVSCTIIYGQDNRSPISKETTHALYVAYAPCGVTAEMVQMQLEGIEENLKLFSSTHVIEQNILIAA
jgi:DNA/RNA-binding domain of Phe-tRNA-synthetase-like protein